MGHSCGVLAAAVKVCECGEPALKLHFRFASRVVDAAVLVVMVGGGRAAALTVTQKRGLSRPLNFPMSHRGPSVPAVAADRFFDGTAALMHLVPRGARISFWARAFPTRAKP